VSTAREFCPWRHWRQSVFTATPDGEFIAFWLCKDRVVAGMTVNVWDVPDHIRALIRSRRLVLASVLADPDASLDSLADKLSARS
jgi:hypothetical protein